MNKIQQELEWRKEYDAQHEHLFSWESYKRIREAQTNDLPTVRKIVLKDFDGPGLHLYEDMLGWQPWMRQEIKSSVSRVIFETYIIKLANNFSFYYVDNDTFYGFHAQGNPVYFKKLARDSSEPYIGWQCEGDPHPHEGEEILYTFEDHTENFAILRTMWDTIRIDGKSLEEVIQRSYIIHLTC